MKILGPNGQTIIGAIGSCTSAYAYSPNYNLKVGDTISFYATSQGNGIYGIQALSCQNWFIH